MVVCGGFIDCESGSKMFREREEKSDLGKNEKGCEVL